MISVEDEPVSVLCTGQQHSPPPGSGTKVGDCVCVCVCVGVDVSVSACVCVLKTDRQRESVCTCICHSRNHKRSLIAEDKRKP